MCDSDFRGLRGVVEGLIRSIGKNVEIAFKPADLVWAQLGAEIMANGQLIGTAGIVSEAVKDTSSLRGEVHQLDNHHCLARHKMPGEESQTIEIHYLVYNIYAEE